MNGDLISRSALLEAFNAYRDKHGDDCPWHISAIETVIEAAPAVDTVAVVRCKKCKHYEPYEKPVEDFDGRCLMRACETDEEEFCSYGERKDA